MDHLIDATGKTIGRVATEAAHHLMGKSLQAFARNKIADVKVIVSNAGKTRISSKKTLQKKYVTYSGYPSGIKETTLKKVVTDKGHREVIRRAVFGMLPKNRLRAHIIKNLEVTE